MISDCSTTSIKLCTMWRVTNLRAASTPKSCCRRACKRAAQAERRPEVEMF